MQEHGGSSFGQFDGNGLSQIIRRAGNEHRFWLAARGRDLGIFTVTWIEGRS
jgi:hypothetical protein